MEFAMKKSDLLHATVDHYDIKTVNVVPMIDMMEKTRRPALQARNLARAAKIVDEMVADKYCGIILTLAGLIPAGQKRMLQRVQTGQA
jgi:deoxyhypusine synthase